jgi:general secretion pathway protein N
VPERVGPLLQYGEIAARPVFSTDRRPQPFVLQQEGEAGAEEQPFDFVLTSVLLTPTVQVAIVQPTAGGESVSMKLGESPEDAHGWRLVSLQPRSATFDGPQGQKTLELRTFDGSGGQPPTAVARPADRPTPTSTPVPLPPPTSAPPAATTATRPAATKPATPTAPPPQQQVTTPEEQMEAIRKRIEARRAQLRAEAQRNQNQQPPAKP